MGIVTCQISVSLDGYMAGPNQSVEDPLGEGGERLHEWAFADDADPVDRDVRDHQLDGNGAYILGRNMFGPIRGAWEGDWRGWWGEDPPYHTPVFVLTHYAREPLEMEGGTTFHFVTGGVEAALEQARAAAGERNVAIGGGASTLQQCFRAGAIDEILLHVVPITLGGGERLFEDVGDLRMEAVEVVGSRAATHVRYRVAR